MLTGLSIRDIVLIRTLDLDVQPGLTVLTGETGAGKSILLDALGLALGARSESGLVRSGATQASASAVFEAPDDEEWRAAADEGGFGVGPGGDLILRRVVGSDGRSRAWVNDQIAGVGALRNLGTGLVEIHGQHQTVGLLDWKTHRTLLDAYGGLEGQAATVSAASRAVREAEHRLQALKTDAERTAAEAGELAEMLAELDALAPRADEETELAGERALLGAAEKALEDLAAARESLGGDKLSQKLSAALRAVEHARQRAVQSGAGSDHAVIERLSSAVEAIDRTLVEASEALAAVDAAADAFEFEPGRLDKAEERLFALRAQARKLNTTVDALPSVRDRIRERLRLVEDGAAALKAADAEAAESRAAYDHLAETLSEGRNAAGDRLAAAVASELGPLKLDRARFRVALEPIEDGRRGPNGLETVRFEIATNAGSPFGPLDAIASGGELARFALAMKAALAGREDRRQPVMIFDEVDQGVGGAVAEAVGQRLKRLAATGQVLVVTHSPQVAARGDHHWKIRKADTSDGTVTTVETLDPRAREEEIARMLAGAEITEAARAAARALIGA